jgi:hypothetical protein
MIERVPKHGTIASIDVSVIIETQAPGARGSFSALEMLWEPLETAL